MKVKNCFVERSEIIYKLSLDLRSKSDFSIGFHIFAYLVFTASVNLLDILNSFARLIWLFELPHASSFLTVETFFTQLFWSWSHCLKITQNVAFFTILCPIIFVYFFCDFQTWCKSGIRYPESGIRKWKLNFKLFFQGRFWKSFGLQIQEIWSRCHRRHSHASRHRGRWK